MRSIASLAAALLGALAISGCSAPPENDDPAAGAGAASGASGGSVGGASTGGSAAGGKGGSSSGGSGSGGTSSSSGGGSTAGSGGSVGGASTGGTGATIPGAEFKLLWQDDFDGFDDGRWEKASHTFAENAARFSPANAVVEGGVLKLRVTNQPNDDKPFTAGEVRTKATFKYGRFEARIKFAKGSGIVSSLFTYLYDPWNEIDIEYLGNQLSGVQYNLITQGGSGLEYQPLFDPLDFQPFADFHEYAIEWVPSEVRFYVDGAQRWVDARNVPERLTNPVSLHMNCWPTNNDATNFAGPLDTGAFPAEAQYDWVRVYEYAP